MMRNRTYVDMEKISDQKHVCRLTGVSQEAAS